MRTGLPNNSQSLANTVAEVLDVRPVELSANSVVLIDDIDQPIVITTITIKHASHVGHLEITTQINLNNLGISQTMRRRVAVLVLRIDASAQFGTWRFKDDYFLIFKYKAPIALANLHEALTLGLASVTAELDIVTDSMEVML